MAIVVEHPGQFTTVQDLGRPHLRGRGVPAGGAVDPVSLRVANWLAGNADDAAALECALVGPVLRCTTPAVVAVCGAAAAGVPHDRAFVVPRGGRLDLSRLTGGRYAYVAVRGGLDVPVVLDARGTDVRLGFGGLDGRPLRAGDRLPVADLPPHAGTAAAPRPARDGRPAGPSGVRVRSPVDPGDDSPFRVVDGKDAAAVGPDWCDAAFTVSPQSDRVGVRLSGPAVAVVAAADAASGVVVPGTVQLPGDGVPIVLLADAQTLGGYPQIAHVIAADLPRLAQCRPGRTVRFRRVSLDAAHAAARRQARALGLLRYGLASRISP